jgi:hypothetical protein
LGWWLSPEHRYHEQPQQPHPDSDHRTDHGDYNRMVIGALQCRHNYHNGQQGKDRCVKPPPDFHQGFELRHASSPAKIILCGVFSQDMGFSFKLLFHVKAHQEAKTASW